MIRDKKILTCKRHVGVSSRAGFGIAPILYMLGLIGVGAGVLFSSYSQSIRNNITVTNGLSVKNDLDAAVTTLAATSVLGADAATLCPPKGGTASANCANAPVKMVDLSGVSASDPHLPSNYTYAVGGGITEVGVFTAGAGVKQLDPWGHYYIVCRWENGATSASPAFEILSAGSKGRLSTQCGATTAAADNYSTFMNAANAVNRAAIWQVGTLSSGSAGVYYGKTGSQLGVDDSGNLIVPGNITAGGSYSSASGDLTLTSGTIAAASGAFTGGLTAEGSGFSVGTGGAVAAASGAFTGGLTAENSAFSVTSGGAISAGNSLFTVTSTGDLMVGGSSSPVFSVTEANGNTSVTGTLGVSGLVTLGSSGASLGTSMIAYGKVNVAAATLASGSSTPLLTVGKPTNNNSAPYPFYVDQFGAVVSNSSVSATSISASSVSGGAISASTVTASGEVSAGSAVVSGNIKATGTIEADGGFIGSSVMSASSITWGNTIVPQINGGTGFAATSGQNLLNDLGVMNGAYLNTALLSANMIPGADLVSNSVTSSQLSTTGVTPGTYNSITVDAEGRVTSANNLSTTSNGISDGAGESIAASAGSLTIDVGSSEQGYWTRTGLMIGSTTEAKDKLDVYGAVAIGTTYAGTTAAPANGLIVAGSVGIGTSNPTSALTVNGTITANTFSGSGSGLTNIGTSAISGTLGVANGGTGNATQFTAGSVVFAGTSGIYAQDNSKLFWDDANYRLGIGTTVPKVSLDLSQMSDSLALPVGSVNPTTNLTNGELRYNPNALDVSTGAIEAYVNGAWTSLLTAASTSGANATWNGSVITVPYGGTGLTSLGTGGIYMGNGTSALALSALSDNGSLVSSSENIDATSKGFVTEITNATAVANKLAAVNASGQAVIAPLSATDGIVGVAVGISTSGIAQIAVGGQASCAFDGPTTAGDFVTVSTSMLGDCADSGTTRSQTSQTIGTVLSTHTSAGVYAVALNIAPSSNAGGISSAGSFVGQCGSDNLATSLTSTPVNLCASGVAINPTTGSAITPLNGTGNPTWWWLCAGGGLSGSGTSMSCSANAATVNGACKTYSTALTSVPASNASLCTAGTASAVSNNYSTWTWTCLGAGGGTSSSLCTVEQAASCGGLTNGAVLSSPPTQSTGCNSGTLYPLTGPTASYQSGLLTGWTWSCVGGDASTTPCSAVYSQAGACGSANGTVALNTPTGAAACAVGSVAGGNVTGTAASGYTWTCSSTALGGQSSGQCSTNAFTFTDQSSVSPGAAIRSNALTLTWSGTGTMVATCGGNCSGFVQNGLYVNSNTISIPTSGETVSIQQTASTSVNTATTPAAWITLSGTTTSPSSSVSVQSTGWTVTTGEAFTNIYGASPGATVQSNMITLPTWVGASKTVSCTGCAGIYYLGSWHSGAISANVTSGDTVAIEATAPSSGSSSISVSILGAISTWVVTDENCTTYITSAVTASTGWSLPHDSLVNFSVIGGGGGYGASGGVAGTKVTSTTSTVISGLQGDTVVAYVGGGGGFGGSATGGGGAGYYGGGGAGVNSCSYGGGGGGSSLLTYNGKSGTTNFCAAGGGGGSGSGCGGVAPTGGSGGSCSGGGAAGHGCISGNCSNYYGTAGGQYVGGDSHAVAADGGGTTIPTGSIPGDTGGTGGTYGGGGGGLGGGGGGCGNTAGTGGSAGGNGSGATGTSCEGASAIASNPSIAGNATNAGLISLTYYTSGTCPATLP